MTIAVLRYIVSVLWTAAVTLPVFAWSPWSAWAQCGVAIGLAVPSVLLLHTVWDVAALTWRYGEPVNWPRHRFGGPSRGRLRDWRQDR